MDSKKCFPSLMNFFTLDMIVVVVLGICILFITMKIIHKSYDSKQISESVEKMRPSLHTQNPHKYF